MEVENEHLTEIQMTRQINAYGCILAHPYLVDIILLLLFYDIRKYFCDFSANVIIL